MDQATKFSLAGNPGVLLGWTEHELSYEDTDHNFESERSAFTLVDFIAQDPQFTQHFVCVPRADWSDDLVPLARYLELSGREKTDKVPYVLLIDSEKVLYRAVVDEKLVDAARRCLSSWRTLQEMAGINNSHAIAAVSEAERTWTDELAQQRLQADPVTTTTPDNSAPIPDQAPAAEPPPPLEDTAPSSDEPWIETIRCTTCNECTQLNDRMFAYDGEKRAYIADPDAGTYRDLVEAAETCQVAIIHPGKPRNPDEADLEALLERAAPFI